MERLNNRISIGLTEMLLGNTYDESRARDAKVCYSIETIIDNIEKLLILITLFGIMGKLKECLICYVVILLTRTCMGGIHMSTWHGCTIMTIVVHMCAIECGIWIDIIFLRTWIFVIAMVLMMLVDPLPSPKRPKYKGKRRQKVRIRGCAGIVIAFGASYFLINFSNYILWVLLLEIIEVVCFVASHAISQMKNISSVE